MKRIIVFLAFVSSLIAQSQSNDALFTQASKFYENAQYEEAVKLYEQIEKTEQHSSELYFNLGNSYYKLNKVAPSIYYFEKALKLDPKNEDAINNLAFANRMKLDAIEVMPKSVFEKFSNRFIYALNYNTWAWLAVIFSFLGAILFLLYHFSYSSGKKLLFFNTSILSALLLIIALVFAYKTYNHKASQKGAIVFSQETEIKNAPTLNSDTVFELHEGTKVIVLDAIDDWKKIRLADGKTGWIIADDIREI